MQQDIKRKIQKRKKKQNTEYRENYRPLSFKVKLQTMSIALITWVYCNTYSTEPLYVLCFLIRSRTANVHGDWIKSSCCANFVYFPFFLIIILISFSTFFFFFSFTTIFFTNSVSILVVGAFEFVKTVFYRVFDMSWIPFSYDWSIFWFCRK